MAPVEGRAGVPAGTPVKGRATPADKAAAGSTPPEGGKPATLATVTVTGPGAADLRRYEITNRIVIGRAEIERHNDNTLSDVMRRLPGVTVSPTDGIRLRGLGAGYIQILLDGSPVPNDFSLDSIAPDLIERIEILPTPMAEYSTKAIAGTINIILRKHARTVQRNLKLNAGKDGGNWYPSASLLLSDKRDGFSWSLNATATRPQDHIPALITERSSAPNGTIESLRETREVLDIRTTTLNLAPQLSWNLGENDTVTWNSLVQHSDEEWTRNRQELVLVGGPSEYPHNVWTNDSRTWSGRTDLEWRHKYQSGSTLNVKSGFNYLSRNTDFDFIGFGPDGVFQLDRNIVSDAIDRNFTSVGKYSAEVGDTNTIAVGWDGSYTARSESRLQHDLDIQGNIVGIIDESYDAAVKRMAFYGQDEWQALDELQVYLGVRWEGLYTHVEGRTISSVNNDAKVFSPIVQIVWKVPGSEKDQIRMGLARTFSAPAPRTLVPRRYTVNNSNGPTNPDIQGNPNLLPEIAWGLDGAYEHYFGESAMVSLSGYARRIDEVTINSLFEQDGVWISMPINAGKAHTYGVTLETKFALKDLIETEAKVQFHANLTRNWSRVDSVPGPDNHLATQTPLSGTVGMDWNPMQKFEAGWDYTYVGGSSSRVSEFWSTGTWPTRTLDLYANLQVNPKNKLTLSLSNLLHQKQGMSTRFNDASGASSRLYAIDTSTGIKLQFEHQL
jgi:outer membrane receptor protein involved in Fe transport